MKTLYKYKGPVLIFGKVVAEWSGETEAVSPAKALSNLSYQFKKKQKLEPTARCTLLEKYLKKTTINVL